MQSPDGDGIETASIFSQHQGLPTPMIFSQPREIRDKIFYNLLVSRRLVQWPSATFRHHLCPAFLRTCRTAYEEACPILYRRNAFLFEHPSDIAVFRAIMDPVNSSSIASVQFRMRDKDARQWLMYVTKIGSVRALESDLPHLRYLHVSLGLNEAWWQHDALPEDNLRAWHSNSRLKQLCMSLESRTKAEITVVCSLKIPRDHFEHLRRSHTGPSTRLPSIDTTLEASHTLDPSLTGAPPEAMQLVSFGPNKLQSRLRIIHSAKVCLDLIPPPPEPVGPFELPE
ncbi:MAG: hypothetical protein M1828_001620 [Chrysothrix sp. TS-e1954]|nr:MAG: hypothetical protein M1828_001620 [Chrysothrix sp. TS-e1954]